MYAEVVERNEACDDTLQVDWLERSSDVLGGLLDSVGFLDSIELSDSVSRVPPSIQASQAWSVGVVSRSGQRRTSGPDGRVELKCILA